MHVHQYHTLIEHYRVSRKAHVITSMTLRQFAVMLTAIFVPLFLYEIGYSLSQVALFFIATQALRALLFLPAIKTIQRFGVHHTLSLSYLLAGMYLLGLYIAQFSTAGIWIALFLGAAMEVFYWGAAHIDIVSVVSKKSMSRSISLINSLLLIAQAAAPIIGGVVAATAGPEYALLLGFAILLLATAAIHSEVNHEKTSSALSFKITKPDKYLRRNVFANTVTNFTDWTSGVIWPIYIYFLLDGFDTVGIIVGIGTFLSLAVNKFVGKNLDAHPKIFPFGLALRSLSFPARFVATTSSAVFSMNIFSSIAAALYAVPQGSYYHRNAKPDPVNYVFWVEVFGEFGKMATWILMLIFLGFMNETEASRMMLLVAAPLVLFVYLFVKPPPKS